MNQASRIIAQWSGATDVISRERIACAAWNRAVGKKVAQHTRAVKMVRTSLIVEVEDEIWRGNLWSLRHQILQNLTKALGEGIVAALEFRVMPARIAPQRETIGSLSSEAPGDEADGIADPVLRRIYKVARHRESA